MKNLQIKFSHNYRKLQGMGSYALLVAVIPYSINRDTPQAMIDFDTTYEGGKYYLKEGSYVLLLFLGRKGLFSTIRPRKGRYGDKLEYYSRYIGWNFEIVIKKEIP